MTQSSQPKDPLRQDYREAFVGHPEREQILERHDVALLCIDLQYLDAARGEGVFSHPNANRATAEAEEYYFNRLEQTVIPNVQKLQSSFRNRGLEVIHCRICALTRDGRDRSEGHKRLNLLAKPGSREAEFLTEVAPKGDEIIIDKTTSGVFSSTNIHYVLQNIGVKYLFLCGVYTNECVESAARTACDLGYFVRVVGDACATVTQELHEASITTMRDRYAGIVATEEVAHEFREKIPRDPVLNAS